MSEEIARLDRLEQKARDLCIRLLVDNMCHKAIFPIEAEILMMELIGKPSEVLKEKIRASRAQGVGNPQ